MAWAARADFDRESLAGELLNSRDQLSYRESTFGAEIESTDGLSELVQRECVSVEEIEQIASGLRLSVDEFARRYVRQVGDRYSLVERANGECVFWDAAVGCKVYESRPTQCRTWPFWPEHLKARAAWSQLQRVCPGTREGRLHSLEEIEESARSAARALSENE